MTAPVGGAPTCDSACLYPGLNPSCQLGPDPLKAFIDPPEIPRDLVRSREISCRAVRSDPDVPPASHQRPTSVPIQSVTTKPPAMPPSNTDPDLRYQDQDFFYSQFPQLYHLVLTPWPIPSDHAQTKKNAKHLASDLKTYGDADRLLRMWSAQRLNSPLPVSKPGRDHGNKEVECTRGPFVGGEAGAEKRSVFILSARRSPTNSPNPSPLRGAGREGCEHVTLSL